MHACRVAVPRRGTPWIAAVALGATALVAPFGGTTQVHGGGDPPAQICIVETPADAISTAGDEMRRGLNRAESRFGVDGVVATPATADDVAAEVEAFAESGTCDLIIGDFLAGIALQELAPVYPDQRFVTLDWVPGEFDNVRGVLFAADEAAFLAGYASARLSETGKVGVFGGIQIDGVTAFMDGFALGVDHHNDVKGTTVEVLGWDPARAEGLFAGGFDDIERGRELTHQLYDEGADIVLPVAGPLQFGALTAAEERHAVGEHVRVIGVDDDLFRLVGGDPDRLILTSVIKKYDKAVYHQIRDFVNGRWEPGIDVEDLRSRGVGLASWHKARRDVPKELRKELRTIKRLIIRGELDTRPVPFGATVCVVTDVGGLSDRAFNAQAWAGALRAVDELPGVTASFIESQSEADYAANIDTFANLGCGLIVTVGFTMVEATAEVARAHPDIEFAIVDSPVFDAPPWCAVEPAPGAMTCGGDVLTNVRGSSFAVEEPSFLAGYLAAGQSASGFVGTYGGLPIPPVTDFMDGFIWGVDHYNDEKGAAVQGLGWDPDTGIGSFIFSFGDQSAAADATFDLLDQGADIVMPVAGPAGIISAAICQFLGTCLAIGVDADQFVATPEFGDVWLTSAVKGVEPFVFDSVDNVVATGAPGAEYRGTLANGGVSLAPYHDLEDAVPQALQDEVEALRQMLIDGTLVLPPS